MRGRRARTSLPAGQAEVAMEEKSDDEDEGEDGVEARGRKTRLAELRAARVERHLRRAETDVLKVS